MTDELYHYGVKNQRWGTRKYQNEDGTWTEEGKARRRYGKGKNRDTESFSIVTQEEARKIRKEDIKDATMSTLESVGKSSSNMVKALNTTNNNSHINYNKYKSRLSNISDNDLRNMVNRMQLENNYIRLQEDRSPPPAKRGKEIVIDVLKATGAVITVTASAVAMADGINNLITSARQA